MGAVLMVPWLHTRAVLAAEKLLSGIAARSARYAPSGVSGHLILRGGCSGSSGRRARDRPWGLPRSLRRNDATWSRYPLPCLRSGLELPFHSWPLASWPVGSPRDGATSQQPGQGTDESF
jgi:hypothetical protein